MAEKRRALISVSDKKGVADFARGLVELGFEIVSTGGTLRHLQEHGVAARAVSEVTGSPEILGGRVKSLHPKIHGGILADRSKPEHMAELAEHGIAAIDLVAVNLYPFEQTVSSGAPPEEVVEQIDIGGPGMTRAAAKNFASVLVVVDPTDYDRVLDALRAEEGEVPFPFARQLALKAFEHTAAYDRAIAASLRRQVEGAAAEDAALDEPPETLELTLQREFVTRYGENPHQAAAVYRDTAGAGLLGGFDKLQGKELSWNNMLDADAARKLVALFAAPAVAIIKHNNPCGVGRGDSLAEAYERALASDPVSAFGSIVAINRAADGDLAEAMRQLFVEVVVAPDYSQEALEIFARKKNLRLLQASGYAWRSGELELRGIDGGFLAQTPDGAAVSQDDWRVVTESQPSDDEWKALDFAWRVMRYVKSNAILITNSNQTVGVGAGQMSRVDACHLAIRKAELAVAGCIAASDAFFPFRDGLDVLADAGVRAVIQPGGSKRDDEVIAAADERGLAMVLSGQRHFRH